MNRNTFALLLPSYLRPTPPKPGSYEFCSDQGFSAGNAQGAGSKAWQHRLALLQEAFCYGDHLHASEVPSQTVSRELIQFGYFPL
jgi:hypothetical protein